MKLLYAPRVEKWEERAVVFVNALTRRPLVPLYVTRAPTLQVIYGILTRETEKDYVSRV